MTSATCRAANQRFCRHHGQVSLAVEPEPHQGRVDVALALSATATGLEFGQDTGMDMGGLTQRGVPTDATTRAIALQHGSSLYGPHSAIALLGTNGIFNTASLRQELHDQQHKLEVDTWVTGESAATRHAQNVNIALTRWVGDATQRVNILARDFGEARMGKTPVLPDQGLTERLPLPINTARPRLAATFARWFPNLTQAA